ncbi:MAG: hypothetical protein DRO01_06770, partial [Thermoproteota archaeon]
MGIGLRQLIAGAASLLVLVGALALSLLFIPWHLLPGRGAFLAVLGFAAAFSAARAARGGRGWVRSAAWLAAVVLVGLSLAAVGSALGFRVIEESPYTSATLTEVPCDGPPVLDVTAVPFHVYVEPWDGEAVSAVVEPPSNLSGEEPEG